MNKEPQPSLPQGSPEPSKELVKMETSVKTETGSVHEQRNDATQINFEKALGALYEELSDEDKARLNYAVDQDEKLRSLLASMTNADFGGMLGGLSSEEFEAQARPYRDLIEGIITEQTGANSDQRNQEVTKESNDTPASGLMAEDSDDDGESSGERAGLGANALVVRMGISAWLDKRKQKREAKRADRRRKWANDLLAKGISPEEVRKRVNKRERNRTIRNRLIMGAGALAAAGVTWYLIDRFGGSSNPSGNGGGNEGASGDWDMPKAGAGQDIISENQLHEYFNVPNPMEAANGNDLTAGNEALANMDKAGAVANLENAFRGDAHMTAMWASQLGIPGAPEMPPLDTLRNNPGAVNAFNIQINDWADTLNNNVRLRADVTNQLIEKVNSGNLGDKITLNPGYMSTGRYNAPEGAQGLIFGAGPGEVFLDTEVWHTDVPAVELVIDGHTYLWEPGCDQLAYQGPAASQSVGTPQTGGYTSTTPVNPGEKYTPGTPGVPNEPTTPGTPSTPSTPGNPGGETPNEVKDYSGGVSTADGIDPSRNGFVGWTSDPTESGNGTDSANLTPDAAPSQETGQQADGAQANTDAQVDEQEAGAGTSRTEQDAAQRAQESAAADAQREANERAREADRQSSSAGAQDNAVRQAQSGMDANGRPAN